VSTYRILVAGPDTYSCGTTYAVTNGIINGLGIALRITWGESS
jgi:hypothetical protein